MVAILSGENHILSMYKIWEIALLYVYFEAMQLYHLLDFDDFFVWNSIILPVQTSWLREFHIY